MNSSTNKWCDFDRYGPVPRYSPRQADLILIVGNITMKIAPSLVQLYEKMPEPKYVIPMVAFKTC
jgi:NAD(P)H-quinone oxidoreductase subunit K